VTVKKLTPAVAAPPQECAIGTARLAMANAQCSRSETPRVAIRDVAPDRVSKRDRAMPSYRQ